MITVTKDQLKQLAPQANDGIIADVSKYLGTYLEKYEVNTPLRLAHFIAQCAHESDGFHTLEEYASGAGYEGRKDLGNVNKGDGVRYKGRGMIQLTGRANYRQYGNAIGVDLENHPELAATGQISVQTALEYWKVKGLNTYADRDDIDTITRRINGGTNGLASRIAYLAKAKKIFATLVVVAGTVVAPTVAVAQDYSVDQAVLVATIKKAEPMAGMMKDDAIILEFKKRLPPGITYSNGVIHGLDKNSQAYKDFVAKNPKVPFDTLLTPLKVAAATPADTTPILAEKGDKSDYVKLIQGLLVAKGATITPDGDFGNKTEVAMINFQKTVGLNPTGKLDNDTLTKLRA